MLTQSPKISIIVPIYNAEKYLSRCIKSILNQSFLDFELLLINDGSRDYSGSICDKYSNNDQRITVLHTENKGVSSARNNGLEYAQGDYVLFVDADDWIESNSLDLLYKTIISENLDLLQFSFRTVNTVGKVLQNYSTETTVSDLHTYIEKDAFLVCVGGTMIKKTIIDSNNLRFQTNLKLAEDQLFILSAIKFSKRMKRIADVLYNYYQNDNSATATAKFDDIIHSIVELNNFKYKEEFKKHIERMIVLQANVALNVEKCSIVDLYKATRKIIISPIFNESQNFNMKLLTFTWNKFSFFSFVVVRVNYIRIKTLNIIRLRT